MTSNLALQKQNISLILLINSTFITLFLFFIDEGYYNFNWMSNAGAWFVFLMYSLFLFFVQIGISKLIGLKIKSSLKIVLGIISITTLGVLALGASLIL